MEFLLENASEILRLAGALALTGVFILCLYLARTIYIATQVLKKANDLIDLFITYIQKPISMIIKAEKLISGIMNRFK